ncbi:MAG: hypothetical protein K2K66_05320 [Ruminococcus sp.]|nr:hypothetical protein [Ruminococcus sp.]
MDYEFDIIQLDETDIKRVADFIKQNPAEGRYIDSITLALTYKDIKICSTYEWFREDRLKKITTRKNYVVIIYPDKIISAECFCRFGKCIPEYGVSQTTGNPELDTIISEASCIFSLYEEDIFAWLIDKQSDGSESYYEYGDDYERIRCEIIQYEEDMRKKYLL